MKKLLFIGFFLSLHSLFADCVLFPLSLTQRVNAAELIVEAQVQSKTAYWNSDQTMIFTANHIQISRVFKGSHLLGASSLDIITSGGVIGLKAVKVEPELELEAGEIGIFLLVYKNGEWVAESGPQGFIKIDKHTAEANDVFYQYPAFTIQDEIKKITGVAITDINAVLTKITLSTKRAAPSISSFSPMTLNAGTSSVLTILGSNFGSTQDTNSVQFRDADDGGQSYVKALQYDYISWSDTMVKLIVRTKAGTGKFRVVAGSNGAVVSSDTLHIEYAHLNVVSGDTLAFETRQIGMNNNNGITWKMNTTFYDSTGARTAFVRSLEKWRCGTYINWDTLGHVNYSAIKSDGINMCAWDTNSNMPNGVLAQCFSFWSGCFTPGLKWYVNELDIRFRIKPTNTTNWNYTSGAPQSNQFHFETVATHELGHGHQLGHVINKKQVMHYSIANGQLIAGLSSNDIDAGDYVIGKSGSSVCGRNAHTKLNAGNCAIIAPAADYYTDQTTICKNESITFTDTSTGNISAYSWNFGSGANPSTANTKGPHVVQYTSGGTKSITLTVTTINGNLQKNRNVTVINDSRVTPDFTYLAAEKGKLTFVNKSVNPSSSKWYFGDGDSSALITPSHTYTAGGTYNVTLRASNTCNTSDTTLPIKFAWLNFGVNKNSACINEAFVFSDSSDNLPASYAWTFPGGTPANATGKGPHKVSFGSAGNKSATLSITVAGAPNQQYTISNVATVNTDTLSSANFTYGYYGKNIVGFQSLSKGSNLTYKWVFGDGDSSAEKNPIHTYTNANSQTVRLMISGNCGSSDTTITLRDFTGINAVLAENELFLYPNPSNGKIKIQLQTLENFQIEIFDLQGRLLISKNCINNGEIDIRDLSSGTYFVKAFTSDGIKTSYLLVE